MVTPQNVADAMNANGLDTPQAVSDFFAAANKPAKRAAVQALIDAENKQFNTLTQTHNQTLQTLQAQLDAI